MPALRAAQKGNYIKYKYKHGAVLNKHLLSKVDENIFFKVNLNKYE